MHAVEKTIAANLNYARGYFPYGWLLNGVGAHAEVAHILKKGFEVNPPTWQAYYELGKAYLERGNLAQTGVNLRRT